MEAESKPAPKERIVLDTETMNVIEAHINLVRERLGDIVSVSPKQMVNFILQRRASELTDSEVGELKAKFADKVKVLLTIAERAKLAKREGREYCIEDELKIFETLSVSGNGTVKRARKKRLLADPSPSVVADPSSLHESSDAVEIDANDVIETQSPTNKKSKSIRKSAQEFDLENS